MKTTKQTLYRVRERGVQVETFAGKNFGLWRNDGENIENSRVLCENGLYAQRTAGKPLTDVGNIAKVFTHESFWLL